MQAHELFAHQRPAFFPRMVAYNRRTGDLVHRATKWEKEKGLGRINVRVPRSLLRELHRVTTRVGVSKRRLVERAVRQALAELSEEDSCDEPLT